MIKYNDSDPLYTILRGYHESTRMLMFHSTEIEANKLQEALNIIGRYNQFDSKRVGKILLEKFGRFCEFIVGREYSVCVYVKPIQPYIFELKDLAEISEAAIINEVGVNNEGILRLWWD
jgi:hypothetical protein